MQLTQLETSVLAQITYVHEIPQARLWKEGVSERILLLAEKLSETGNEKVKDATNDEMLALIERSQFIDGEIERLMACAGFEQPVEEQGEDEIKERGEEQWADEDEVEFEMGGFRGGGMTLPEIEGYYVVKEYEEGPFDSVGKERPSLANGFEAGEVEDVLRQSTLDSWITLKKKEMDAEKQSTLDSWITPRKEKTWNQLDTEEVTGTVPKTPALDAHDDSGVDIGFGTPGCVE
jgi:hypothetical protein